MVDTTATDNRSTRVGFCLTFPFLTRTSINVAEEPARAANLAQVDSQLGFE